MREDRLDSLRKSKWPIFDRTFAAMIKEKHPDIWDEGGNIKGDDQYEILTKIAEQGGVAKTEDQIKAIELREAWVARHLRDYRLPGVVAQIKWLAVGSRGENHMKNVIRDEISKKELKQDSFTTAEKIGEYLEHQGFSDEEIDNFLEHFGVKGMRWGVRKNRTKQEAKKDYKNYRKALGPFKTQTTASRKASTAANQKKRSDPEYKKYYDRYDTRRKQRNTAFTLARIFGPYVLLRSVLAINKKMARDPEFAAKAIKFATASGNMSRKVINLPARAVKLGASLFTKNVKVYAPGKGPKIGTYQNAQVVRKALGV